MTYGSENYRRAIEALQTASGYEQVSATQAELIEELKKQNRELRFLLRSNLEEKIRRIDLLQDRDAGRVSPAVVEAEIAADEAAMKLRIAAREQRRGQ